MNEFVLIFKDALPAEEIGSFFEENGFGAALPIFSTSYQVATPLSRSQLLHELRRHFAGVPYALAKCKPESLFIDTGEA